MELSLDVSVVHHVMTMIRFDTVSFEKLHSLAIFGTDRPRASASRVPSTRLKTPVSKVVSLSS